MKRARRLTSSLEVAMKIPRPGLTPRQLAILTKAFKNLLVASIAVTDKGTVQPLIKQRKAIRLQKVIKPKPLVKMKRAIKRRKIRGTGKTTKRTRTS